MEVELRRGRQQAAEQVPVDRRRLRRRLVVVVAVGGGVDGCRALERRHDVGEELHLQLGLQ